MKSLMGLQHPHIEPVLLAAHTENGCLVIRKSVSEVIFRRARLTLLHIPQIGSISTVP